MSDENSTEVEDVDKLLAAKIQTMTVNRDPFAAALTAAQMACSMTEQLTAVAQRELVAAATLDMEMTSIEASAQRVEEIASHPNCPPHKRAEAEAVCLVKRQEIEDRNKVLVAHLTRNAQLAEHAGLWAMVAKTMYDAAKAVREIGPEATANPDPERPKGPALVK